MSISKVFITTGITAIVIAIATAMTASTFPNVAVFATFLSPSEQVGNDTTTDATGHQKEQDNNSSLFT